MKFITFNQADFSNLSKTVTSANKALETAIDDYLSMALSHALSTGKADKVCTAINLFLNSEKRALKAQASAVKDYFLASCDHLKNPEKGTPEKFPVQVKKNVLPENFSEEHAAEKMQEISTFSRWKKEVKEGAPKTPSFDIVNRFNGFTKQVNKFFNDAGIQDDVVTGILDKALTELQAHLEIVKQGSLNKLKEVNPSLSEEELLKSLTSRIPHYIDSATFRGAVPELKTGTNN